MARSEINLFVQAIYIVKTYMDQEKNSPLHGNHLYEIPCCSICLQEMSADFGCFSCGHTYHMKCISQMSEHDENNGNSGNCPNCRKRIYKNEARHIIFPLQRDSHSAEHLRQLISSLDKSDSKQVEGLLFEIKKMAEQNEKNKYELNQNEKSIKAKVDQIERLNEEVKRQKQQINSLLEDNIQYSKANGYLKKNKLEMQFQERALHDRIAQLSKNEAAFEEHKRQKKIMHGQASELIEYKHQLEKQNANPTEIAARFFDLLIMKNLETLKLKQKMKDYPNRLNDKQLEITACQDKIECLKRELKEIEDKRSAERKKYQDYKLKYRLLLEKARAKEGDFTEIDDSNTYKPIEVPEINFTKELNKPTSFMHSLVTISGRGLKKSTEIIKPKTGFQNRLF